MSKGNFFAVGSDEFAAACKLGMNPAVAFLVLARGTGRDNMTTGWSALSVFKYTGIARRRAKVAIEQLISVGIVTLIQAGDRPRYLLKKPEDAGSLLWLPNELINGAGKECPPITKLREYGQLDLLQKFVELYGLQDLDSDGGLPRTLVRSTFTREEICPIGPFILYGFSRSKATAFSVDQFSEYLGTTDADGNQGAWIILSPLHQLGLLEPVFYMAESDDPDAELIYPVGPYGTDTAMNNLLIFLEESGGKGYAFEAESHTYQGIALKHIKHATLVGLYRLRYRPKTGKTSRWLAIDNEQAEAMVGMVEVICGRQASKNVHIKASQCS